MNISISRDGTELGEWPEEQVRSLYKEGKLLPTDHYWKEGMTEWSELSRMIKPPAPAAKILPEAEKPKLPTATQLIHLVDESPTGTDTSLSTFIASKKAEDQPPPTASFKEKKSFGWRWLFYFFVFLVIKNLFTSFAGNMEGFFLAFTFVVVAAVILDISTSWLYRRNRNVLWSILAVAGISLAVYEYLQGDSLTQTLTETSEKLNKPLPRMMDSITRLDGTSVTANHTFHYRYTVMTDGPPSADEIKAYLWSTLKANYLAHPELQAFRDRGVTFEYDYFNKDGAPITQIVVSPNDLR